MRSPRCCIPITRARKASGCRTSSAGARTSPPSSSSQLNMLVETAPARSCPQRNPPWPGDEFVHLGGWVSPQVEHGLMHDMLDYMKEDPVHRKWHHNKITFDDAAQREVRPPFSHDEVVHGKRSCSTRCPATSGRSTPTCALYGYMFVHPGKKLLFMARSASGRVEP